MIKWIGKSTVELRVATEEEADQLHKQMLQETAENGWTLNSWKETKKEAKSKGEIIDEWIVVNYTIWFSDLKNPDVIVDSIEYNIREFIPELDTEE